MFAFFGIFNLSQLLCSRIFKIFKPKNHLQIEGRRLTTRWNKSMVMKKFEFIHRHQWNRKLVGLSCHPDFDNEKDRWFTYWVESSSIISFQFRPSRRLQAVFFGEIWLRKSILVENNGIFRKLWTIKFGLEWTSWWIFNCKVFHKQKAADSGIDGGRYWNS